MSPASAETLSYDCLGFAKNDVKMSIFPEDFDRHLYVETDRKFKMECLTTNMEIPNTTMDIVEHSHLLVRERKTIYMLPVKVCVDSTIQLELTT